MPLVEITEEQEKILNEAEFARLVSVRNDIAHKIMILEMVCSFAYSQRLLQLAQQEAKEHQSEIDNIIDIKLAVLRKKLDIETPTLHTEL